MAKKSKNPPQLKKDRDYAVVYFGGKRIFLGKWGSFEAQANYKQVVEEWISQIDEITEATVITASPTVDELGYQFLKWAKSYHERRTYDRFRTAIGTMLELYSGLPVAKFGPRKLLVLQDKFVALGYARTYCNAASARFFRGALLGSCATLQYLL